MTKAKTLSTPEDCWNMSWSKQGRCRRRFNTMEHMQEEIDEELSQGPQNVGYPPSNLEVVRSIYPGDPDFDS